MNSTDHYGYYDFSDEPYGLSSADEPGFDGPSDVLSRYWGYDSFRPCQSEIIHSLLDRRDTIGLLPTGGGKSITFQVPALLLPGVAIVVTPLVSLMKDQVDNLRRRNIRAACLYTGMTRNQSEYTFERLARGKIKLLYVAPERLERDTFLSRMARWNVSMIVVDEAHCISQWGYDFRPSYLRISRLREFFPDAPVLALTASATPSVVADISSKLEMKRPQLYTMSFERDNVSFLVRQAESKTGMMIRIFSTMPGSGIVYVRSRKRTLELAEVLANAGISAQAYHAGLDPDEKSRRQDAWIEGRVRVMVATTAFGMGIDKPDVRIVVHYDMPSTLEEYYQEAGRAGRDGKESVAVMLVNSRDKASIKKRVTDAFPPKEAIRHVYDEVCRFLNIPMGEGFGAVFEFKPEIMCERYKLQPLRVLASLSFLSRAGYMDYADDVETRSRVMIRLTRSELYDETFSDLEERVIITMLRSYPGIFTDYVHIDEVWLASDCGSTPDALYHMLISLRRRHVLDYIPRSRTSYLFLRANRCPSSDIVLGLDVYENRRAQMERCAQAMLDYAFNESSCRVGRMLAYFGQNVPPGYGCGKCDVCRAASRKTVFNRERFETVLHTLLASSADGSVSVNVLSAQFPGHTDAVSAYLTELAAAGKVLIDGALVKQC